MERLLFAYAGVGLATGAAALALLALAPFWEKRYAARFGALYGWRWLYACWFRLRRRCLRPRLSRCCWSCPPRCRIRRGQGKHLSLIHIFLVWAVLFFGVPYAGVRFVPPEAGMMFTMAPVSYTHLDVYKRQKESCALRGTGRK